MLLNTRENCYNLKISGQKKKRSRVSALTNTIADGILLLLFNLPNSSKHAAHAKKPEMESVGSYLPKGAARLATGGENFGEVEDRRTDGQTDN